MVFGQEKIGNLQQDSQNAGKEINLQNNERKKNLKILKKNVEQKKEKEKRKFQNFNN